MLLISPSYIIIQDGRTNNKWCWRLLNENCVCVCATLMLLNGVNWKESLRMFSIVIMFTQYTPTQTVWWPHKPTHICLKEECKQKRHFVSGPYQNMCTENISNHQAEQIYCPPVCSLNLFCKTLQSHVSANLTLRSIYVPVTTAVGALMIASGILLLLTAVVLLAGATMVCCTFTLFHIC